MDCSTQGFPVLHYLPEFAQTHVLGVDDAIHPLLDGSIHPLLLMPSINFLLMGGAALPPCSLAWDSLVLESGVSLVGLAAPSSKRTYPIRGLMLVLPQLLIPVPLCPWQAIVNTHLLRRPSNTHRQVWFSFLWGHCSFSLGPGVHKVLFAPSKSLCFP